MRLLGRARKGVTSWSCRVEAVDNDPRGKPRGEGKSQTCEEGGRGGRWWWPVVVVVVERWSGGVEFYVERPRRGIVKFGADDRVAQAFLVGCCHLLTCRSGKPPGASLAVEAARNIGIKAAVEAPSYERYESYPPI